MADRYTLDDAAAAALFGLSKEKYERIGLLYEDEGIIKRTPTQSTGQQKKTRGAFEIPSGSLRALFHNHPPLRRHGPDAQNDRSATRFSQDDIQQATRLRVPSYISTPSGQIRRYDPSTGHSADVLAQFPIEEMRIALMKLLLDRAPSDPRGLKR